MRNIIQRWWRSIEEQRTKDATLEQKHRIRTSEKNWVTPADIEALEEEKVPWLREKRRQARLRKQP
jgi:hypothetical protein